MSKPRVILTFIYLSLVIHLYLFLILSTNSADSSENRRQKQVIINNAPEGEAIVVDTVTSDFKKPDRFVLSDKMNTEKSRVTDPKKMEYNLNNPNLSKNAVTKPPMHEEKSALKEDDQGTVIDTVKQPVTQEPSQSGDQRTPLFDPEKPLEIYMDTPGAESLPTMPAEIASYLIAMKNKIGANWNQFFPIFQYYQGLLKHGKVVVRYEIDPQGNVLNTIIEKSYGYKVLDESCLDAIIYSRNFGPVPKSAAKFGNIKIKFTFTY